MSDSQALVWLPFEADDLSRAPSSLRYELFLPEDGGEVPPSVSEVELYVPPYQFSPRDSDVMSQMGSLRFVQSLSAGIDHLLPFIPEGVTLCRGAGIHDASTAELAVALVLAAQRGIPDISRAQDRGEWSPQWTPSLADRKVLIVGYGSVGAAIERRLDGFEVEVSRVARTARSGIAGLSELPSLLPRADIVILVVPHTEQTHGMVDAEFLARMQDGALLVNVARGPVVQTDALLAELDSGRLRAALDVTDPEPLPEGHPLWRAPGLLVSPHVGGASSAMWPRAHRLVREQLERFAAAQPLQHVVTGDY